MKASEQTRLTLKGVHYAAFASEETSCFSATLCFDGKPVCEVSNDGRGGADHHRPLKGDNYSAMEAKLYPVRAFIAILDPYTYDGGPVPDCGATPEEPMPHNLETAVGDILNAHLVAKEFDRRIKTKLLYTRSDKPGVWGSKVPRTHSIEQVLAHYRLQNPGVTYTALNTMPRDAALAIYRSQA